VRTEARAESPSSHPGLLGKVVQYKRGRTSWSKGAIETSIVARVVGGLTYKGRPSWNQIDRRNSPALIDNNPLRANFGSHHATMAGLHRRQRTAHHDVVDPFGRFGSPTARRAAVAIQGHAGRYEWSLGLQLLRHQFGVRNRGISFTQAGSNPTFDGGIDWHRHLKAASRKSRVFDLAASVGNRKAAGT